MDAFVFCLGSLLKPRVHAALRRDFPLLYILPCMLLGQLIAGLWGLAGLPLALMLLLWSPASGIGRALAAALCAGIISVWVRAPLEPAAIPAEGVTVVAQVSEPPRYPRVGEMLFVAEISSVHPSGPQSFAGFRARCTALDLPWRNSAMIQGGATLLMQARFTFVEQARSPFAFANTLRRDGITAQCKVQLLSVLTTAPPSMRERLQQFIRTRVGEVLGDGERSGLILSMGLGVRDVISERTEWAFKATGLAHLLVVSGCQVTLVFAVMYWCLRRLLGFLPPLYQYASAYTSMGWLACAGTTFFIYMVGVEGSTLRAGLALLFCLISLQLERRGGMLNAVLVSATLISVVWPGAAFEPGVELTYAALGGIMLGKGRRRGVGEFLRVSFLATTATGLVALLWFGSVSLVGFLLNPWLAPLMGLISCELGGVATAAHLLGADSQGIALRAVAWLLEQGRDLVLWCAELSWAQVLPEQWWSCTLLAGGLVAVLGYRFAYVFSQWVVQSGVD